MEPVTTTVLAIGIGKTIITYLMGKGGDFALEQASFKRKVRKIIQKDKKYIRRIFANIKYREYPIEDFLLEKAFQLPEFLYPFGIFPPDKSNKLYKMFCDYVLEKEMVLDPIEEDTDFRPMLEDCVNHHNELVHQIILSPSQRLMEKDMKEFMTFTGYAGHTLDSTAETLEENQALEYAHRQIDGILRALRMDLRFYRFAILMCTIGLMVLAPVVVALYAKYVSQSIAVVSATVCFVIVVLILFFDMAALGKAIQCEKAIHKYTNALWEKNFSRYSRLLDDYNLDAYRFHLRRVEEHLNKTEKLLDERERYLDEREALLDERDPTQESEKADPND